MANANAISDMDVKTYFIYDELTKTLGQVFAKELNHEAVPLSTWVKPEGVFQVVWAAGYSDKLMELIAGSVFLAFWDNRAFKVDVFWRAGVMLDQYVAPNEPIEEKLARLGRVGEYRVLKRDTGLAADVAPWLDELSKFEGELPKWLVELVDSFNHPAYRPLYFKLSSSLLVTFHKLLDDIYHPGSLTFSTGSIMAAKLFNGFWYTAVQEKGQLLISERARLAIELCAIDEKYNQGIAENSIRRVFWWLCMGDTKAALNEVLTVGKQGALPVSFASHAAYIFWCYGEFESSQTLIKLEQVSALTDPYKLLQAAFMYFVTGDKDKGLECLKAVSDEVGVVNSDDTEGQFFRLIIHLVNGDKEGAEEYLKWIYEDQVLYHERGFIVKRLLG